MCKGNKVAKFHTDNKVNVIIYAVEKSLDSYKFNLLHNKQLFIEQLKNNRMGSRTIDEGSMDEKSGMNFSEYVAILSGNTDLLEKAKLEKKIAGLDSERQAFIRSKSSSRSRLDEVMRTVDGNKELTRNALPPSLRKSTRKPAHGESISISEHSTDLILWSRRNPPPKTFSTFRRTSSS